MAELKLRRQRRLKDLLCEIYVIDAAIALVVLLVALISAFRFFRDSQFGLGALAVIGAVVIFLLTIHKIRVLHSAKTDLDWLYVFLEGLRDVMESVGDKDEKFRVCVHVKAGDELWKQLTEYVEGDGKTSSGKAGRIYPRRRGILGKAAKEPYEAKFGQIPNGMSREAYLQKAFEFESHEISQLSGNRKSWGAICIGEPTAFQVVIYCDSVVPGYFSGTKNCSRKKILTGAGVALARRLASR